MWTYKSRLFVSHRSYMCMMLLIARTSPATWHHCGSYGNRATSGIHCTTICERLLEGLQPLSRIAITRSIKIKGYSIRRKQVPMCAAFSITDYKI
jgi:hypothetical protein